MQEEPITAAMCDQCGEVFQTSAQHPSRYCSIACEEGRPESLVGSTLVASGMKFCDYSPDWHRGPDGYRNSELVWVDRDAQEMVVKRATVIGRVDGFENNEFRVAHYDEDYCLTHYHWHNASMVVEQLRTNRWWAE